MTRKIFRGIPSSILAIRVDRMGDMLVSTPLLHALRKQYPQARIDILASPIGALVLANNPDVDHVYVFDKKAPATWPGLCAQLRKQHYSWLLSLSRDSRTVRALTYFLRHNQHLTVGGNESFALPAPHAPTSDHSAPQGNVIETMLTQALRWGCEPQYLSPHLHFFVPAQVEEEMRRRFPPVPLEQAPPALNALDIAGTREFTGSAEFEPNLGPTHLKRVALFIGNIKKKESRWPAEKFAALAQRILEQDDLEVYVLAGPEDAPLFSAFDFNHPRLHSYVGNESLQHTGAFLRTCAALVSSSSGPQHLAVALNVPCVCILHSGNAPWAPVGAQHCAVFSEGCETVQAVTVESVYAELRRWYQGTRSFNAGLCSNFAS